MYDKPSHIGQMQQAAKQDSTRWWPECDDSVAFLTLALNGEAGELSNMVKKTIRGDMSLARASDKRLIQNEVVDVFTYTLLLANRLGIDLERAYESKRRENEERWGGRSVK